MTRWGGVGVWLLAAAGCAKSAPDPFSVAQAHYQALVAQGRPSRDPGFEQVLEALSRVGVDSPSYTKAQALRAALQSARGVRPAPPLAASRRAEDPAVATQQAQCAGLAQALGSARGPQREALARKLTACGQQVDAEREANHPHAP